MATTVKEMPVELSHDELVRLVLGKLKEFTFFHNANANSQTVYVINVLGILASLKNERI